MLSTAYIPLSFDGANIFENNAGRVVVVSASYSPCNLKPFFQFSWLAIF